MSRLKLASGASTAGKSSGLQAALHRKPFILFGSPVSCEFILHLRTERGLKFSFFSPAKEKDSLLEGSTLLQALQMLPPILFIEHLPLAPQYLLRMLPGLSKNNWQQETSLNPFNLAAAAAAKSLQSCPTLCGPIDCSPTGASVPRVLQARILAKTSLFRGPGWSKSATCWNI